MNSCVHITTVSNRRHYPNINFRKPSINRAKLVFETYRLELYAKSSFAISLALRVFPTPKQTDNCFGMMSLMTICTVPHNTNEIRMIKPDTNTVGRKFTKSIRRLKLLRKQELLMIRKELGKSNEKIRLYIFTRNNSRW